MTTEETKPTKVEIKETEPIESANPENSQEQGVPTNSETGVNPNAGQE